ncbi:MAG TPA: HlyD family efflux transporter periplasmic adaptor subunit [Pirellulales bacterium]
MRSLLQVTIAAAVSGALFAALLRLAPARSSQPSGDRPRNETDAATASARAAETRIFAQGVLEGATREIAPRFEVTGRIKTVYARQGAAVAAGDLLAELDADLAELQLAEAETRLKIAQADRERLFAGQSQDQPETLTPDETIADAQVTLAETTVRAASLMLDKLRLRAPVAGVVLRCAAEPGELTGPTDERELFVVVDAQASRVRAEVEELDGLRVSPGQAVLLSVPARDGETYRGTVRDCAPGFRPKSQYRLKPGERLDIRVREVLIDLDDGHDLLVGLPVEVFIEPGR